MGPAAPQHTTFACAIPGAMRWTGSSPADESRLLGYQRPCWSILNQGIEHPLAYHLSLAKKDRSIRIIYIYM